MSSALTSNPFQNQLEKYATLLLKEGLHLSPGQDLLLRGPIAAADFVRLCVKIAYELGARHVKVNWQDEQTSHIRLKGASMEALSDTQTFQWEAEGLTHFYKNNASILSLTGENPDLLKDVPTDRVAAANKAQSLMMANYQKLVMGSHHPWCAAAVSTPAWAAKIFPDKKEEDAVAELWQFIFQATRADLPDPAAAWQEHNAALDQRKAFLNRYQFTELHFQGPGTDLWIPLPEGHHWSGGGELDSRGIYFIANMPTEEIFTLPHCNAVHGTVSSTKPLIYGGNLIDEFTLTFEEGKVVNMKAKVGEEVLKNLLNTDEGARRLGEVALVPHRSPVSDTNLLFYNTLFDENASCHLALGAAYPDTLQNYGGKSQEELKALGFNDSLIHEDFMIGGPQMTITGYTKDGMAVPIFKDGNWAEEQ